MLLALLKRHPPLTTMSDFFSQKRDHLTRMKQARDALRVDNNRLKQRGGLVGHPALLGDFEERKDQVQLIMDGVTIGLFCALVLNYFVRVSIRVQIKSLRWIRARAYVADSAPYVGRSSHGPTHSSHAYRCAFPAR